MSNTHVEHDNIQHGIDNNPTHDAEKGAALGGLGGAAVGAAAGSLTGPVGAVVGAVVGGLAGAGASGAAVGAVDNVDNDNNVTGIGDEVHVKDDGANSDAGLVGDNNRDATATMDPASAARIRATNTPDGNIV